MIFNLYLLASGFEIVFIGLRVLIASIATALFSIPAGVISDRIGRKLSFILGDGMGAAMSLIAISTGNRPLLLVTAAVAGMFGALHGVSEPAFMAENSRAFERVHLFSVAGGTRTASAIIGAALAGLFPLMLLGLADSTSIIGLYRLVAYIGIGGWFASLIPALMLRPVELEASPVPAPPERGLLGGLFANVKHPDRIWKLVLPGILIGTGAGFVLPLMNVYFHEGLGSSEVEIGAIFAAGETFLAIASFLAPLVATRFGKVRSVVLSQLASLPFIVLLGMLPTLGGGVSTIFVAAVLAYIGRITFMNMASPIQSAFEMEILDPSERGTQVGIRMALGATVRGGAVFLGASLMQAGNFLAPFLVMATFYLIAVALFWYFFAGREEELVLSGQPLAA